MAFPYPFFPHERDPFPSERERERENFLTINLNIIKDV